MICPYCGSGKIHKSGKIVGTNIQRYSCNECHRMFSENTAKEGEAKEGFPVERLKQSLRNNPQTISNLSDTFNVAPRIIRQQIESLKEGKYNIIEEGENVEINTQQFTATKHLDPQIWQGDELRFGLVSDNHLCNYNSREEVLHLLYDLFESEGIDTVYNCGNWIDGEFKWNKNEINIRGLTKQIEYAVENYPYREGIKTRFIAGDDHEGWYSQREGINIGEYFQLKREQSGKFDLDYLGYAEADVRLSEPDQKNESWMRVMHPGGGTAYALSYTSQKIVECVPLNSEILTKDGWKLYNEIKIGDDVLGYNIEKQICEWTKIEKIHIHKNQEVIEYHNELFKIKCTRNHKWVMTIESRAGPNHHCVHPSPYKKTRIELKTIDESLGTWRRHRIIQAAISPDGEGYDYADYVDLINRETTESDVLKMTSDQRKTFIYGLLIGEGTIVKKTIIFSQKPNHVLEAFKLACFLEGIGTSSSKYTSKKINGEDKICSRTSIRRKPTKMCNNKSMEIGNSEICDVWCPQTGLGTWVMRQNDTMTITGNSFQGGEKPKILLIGHYHKLGYEYPREVHCIQAATTCDQTLFMRKNKIQAMLGGAIITLRRAEDGIINRCLTDFITLFDRKFYIGNDKYWK